MRLFSSDVPSPSPDDLRAMAQMAGKSRPVVMLRPRLAESPLPPGTSKMGGSPDLPPDVDWPQCRHCGVPLHFVLQLLRSEFAEFPFPPDERLDRFLLFRCPCRYQCPEGRATRYIGWQFVGGKGAVLRRQPDLPPGEPEPIPKGLRESLLKLGGDAESLDRTLTRQFGPYGQPVTECLFDPLRTHDYPQGEDRAEWWGDEYLAMYTRLDDPARPALQAALEAFKSRTENRRGTKIGGFPSWKQCANYPPCACGRSKQFVFQLSSEDRRPPRTPGALFEWSDHGIMIGDVGNVYFFMCAACGTDTIETSWDCG